MYRVFNKVPQSDMGKTIVRKYAPTLDAQSVWRELESHMSTSSKGLNERHRLHANISTTVYDKSWKGTTEQFVLHFHEKFRQIDEVTPLEEHLPHSVRLALLQTAVRSVSALRIVEIIEEYMSLTQSSTGQYSLIYDKYFMCCRMYESDMTKPCSITNRSLAYCTLLGVLWQMCHAWITYGTVRRTVQRMGKLGGTSGKYQETCLFACFWDPYGSLAILGLPIGAFVGLS